MQSAAPAIRFRETISPSSPLEQLLAFCKRSKENARHLAGSPQSPPPLLAFLAKHPDPQTREQVTRNPNTPTGVLFELSAHHPRHLLQNPVFSLLLLEDPELLLKLPSRAARGLLELPEAPPLLLSYAAKDPMEWVRLAAAKHPALPEHLRQRLKEDPSPRVRRCARRLFR